MRAPDGSAYRRPVEIEDAIAALIKLPPAEVVELSRIQDPKAAGYIPSECILHFVRHPELLKDEALERKLFVALRQRVLRAVPVRKKHLAKSGKDGENSLDLEVQDAVIGMFDEMLCLDRVNWNGRLDFYEVRFNMALDRLRATARRDAVRHASPLVSLTPNDESNESLEELETTLRAVRTAANGESVDCLYRLEVRAAINSLPPEERRVIELYYMEDLPIESNDGDAKTIVNLLRCTEKTVRNRRDRGLQMLRNALREEDAQ
jgi:RNA polymerase sigma factor (sigma-70 family)